MSELQALVEDFLAHQKLLFSPSTHEQRAVNLRRFLSILSSWGIVELKQLSLEVLLAYQLVKIKHIKPSGMRSEVSKHTIKADTSSLLAFLRYLFSKGHVFQDFSAHLKSPRLRKKLPRPLEPKVIEQWFSLCDLTKPTGLRDRALLELAYSSGLRAGEIAALDLCDLDLREGLVHITKSKTNEGRITPITRRAKHFLERYLKEARPLFPVRPEAAEALWLSSFGLRLTRTKIGIRVRRTYQAELSHTEPVTMHALRHSCATHLLQNGANIRELQTLLGHRDINSTALYLKTTTLELKETLSRCHPRCHK